MKALYGFVVSVIIFSSVVVAGYFWVSHFTHEDFESTDSLIYKIKMVLTAWWVLAGVYVMTRVRYAQIPGDRKGYTSTNMRRLEIYASITSLKSLIGHRTIFVILGLLIAAIIAVLALSLV